MSTSKRKFTQESKKKATKEDKYTKSDLLLIAKKREPISDQKKWKTKKIIELKKLILPLSVEEKNYLSNYKSSHNDYKNVTKDVLKKTLYINGFGKGSQLSKDAMIDIIIDRKLALIKDMVLDEDQISLLNSITDIKPILKKNESVKDVDRGVKDVKGIDRDVKVIDRDVKVIDRDAKSDRDAKGIDRDAKSDRDVKDAKGIDRNIKGTDKDVKDVKGTDKDVKAIEKDKRNKNDTSDKNNKSKTNRPSQKILLISAGPGSGKTMTLANRSVKINSLFPSDKILVVMFNIAAETNTKAKNRII